VAGEAVSGGGDGRDEVMESEGLPTGRWKDGQGPRTEDSLNAPDLSGGGDPVRVSDRHALPANLPPVEITTVPRRAIGAGRYHVSILGPGCHRGDTLSPAAPCHEETRPPTAPGPATLTCEFSGDAGPATGGGLSGTPDALSGVWIHRGRSGA
jgi:hypothetical protein